MNTDKRLGDRRMNAKERAFVQVGTWTIAAVLLLTLAAAQTPTPPSIGLPFNGDRAASLQADWAKAYGVETNLVNSLGMKLTLIPSGRFDMGPNGSKYRVTLAQPFYLG